jgi:hypothetical protein
MACIATIFIYHMSINKKICVLCRLDVEPTIKVRSPLKHNFILFLHKVRRERVTHDDYRVVETSALYSRD